MSKVSAYTELRNSLEEAQRRIQELEEERDSKQSRIEELESSNDEATAHNKTKEELATIKKELENAMYTVGQFRQHIYLLEDLVTLSRTTNDSAKFRSGDFYSVGEFASLTPNWATIVTTIPRQNLDAYLYNWSLEQAVSTSDIGFAPLRYAIPEKPDEKLYRFHYTAFLAAIRTFAEVNAKKE